LRLLRRCAPGLENRGRFHACKRIAPAAERNPPVRHRASGIRFEHVVEARDRGAEFERVQQGEGPIEACRDRRLARRLEVHLAEHFGTVFVLRLRNSRVGQTDHRGDDDAGEANDANHDRASFTFPFCRNLSSF
jgi:hypothetical protein